jgi:hypothetical protein
LQPPRPDENNWLINPAHPDYKTFLLLARRYLWRHTAAVPTYEDIQLAESRNQLVIAEFALQGRERHSGVIAPEEDQQVEISAFKSVRDLIKIAGRE